MGWAEVVIVALVIVIALLFLLNRAARPLATSSAPKLSPSATQPELDAATEQHIVALVAQGKKIEAIKVLREATGWGLAEAKAYVDNLDRDDLDRDDLD